MSSKRKLPQVLYIAIIGIILAISLEYMSSIRGLMLILPVPFALVSTLVDKKKTLIFAISMLVILLFANNIEYTINIFITAIVPGIIIGSIARNRIFDKDANAFEPVYAGIVATILCTIISLIVSSVFFDVNIVQEIKSIIEVTIREQREILTQSGFEINLKEDEIATYIINLMPTILFLQSTIITLIIYFIETYVLKRMKIMEVNSFVFSEFYLPGNTVLISLFLYIIMLAIGSMNLGLKTDLILINLQLVFNIMFIIQGIAICIHYLKKWINQRLFKPILIYGLILSIFGVMGISFLGMLDSINDFRKVRNYKPI